MKEKKVKFDSKWSKMVEVCGCGKRATKPHKKNCLAWIMNGMRYGTISLQLDMELDAEDKT